MNPTKGADSADFGTKFLVLVQPSDKLLVTEVTNKQRQHSLPYR